MSRIQVTLITDVGGWRSLAPDWDRVLRATPGYTALQSYDFLSTWWEHMRGTRSLFILTFRDGAEVLGLAPFQLTERRILGKSYRALELLGMTEDILVPTMLFPEPHAAELRSALVDYLAEHRRDWDLIELDELALTDPLLGALRELSRRSGLIHRERAFHDCPYLDLASETPASFFAKRSRKLLKNVRASARKLAEVGPVEVTVASAATEIGPAYERFLALEKRSWKRAAEVGMSSDSTYPEFYRSLLAVFAEKHEARVLILSAGATPIAATIAIAFDQVYCSLQIVHDEAYAKYSPGTLLEYHELDGILRERTARRYEFLGGALNNKLRWTSSTIATCCVRARAVEARTQLLDLYEFHAKPAAKTVLRRVGIFKPLPPNRAGGDRPAA